MGLLLIPFCFYKLHTADEPLFWDELGVYGRAIFHLLDNKVSLMPDALPPVLSRGHPTLFVFLNALWMKIFGESLVSGRAFILMLSVSLILSSYFITKHWLNKTIGLFVVIFLIFNPIIIAQAGMMLPELPLALATLWAVHFAVQNKYTGYFLSCSAALLLKETGLIIPVGILVANILINRKLRVKQAALDLAPILVFGAFLCIQRIQHGWFLFPYHVSLMQIDIMSILEKFARSILFVFTVQGRHLLSIPIFVLFVWLVYKRKIFKSFLTPINITCTVILAAMVGFTSINFYMSRYLLLMFPLVGILFGSILEKFDWKYTIPVVVALSSIQLFYIQDPYKFNYDADMGYLHSVQTLKTSIQQMEDKCGPEELILCDFPASVALLDKRFGYLKKYSTLKTTKKTVDDWGFGIHSDPSSFEINHSEIPKSSSQQNKAWYSTSGYYKKK